MATPSDGDGQPPAEEEASPGVVSFERWPLEIRMVLIDELSKTWDGRCGILATSALSDPFRAALEAHAFRHEVEFFLGSHCLDPLRAILRAYTLLPTRMDLILERAHHHETKTDGSTPRSTAVRALDILVPLFIRFLSALTLSGLHWFRQYVGQPHSRVQCSDLEQLVHAKDLFGTRENPWQKQLGSPDRPGSSPSCSRQTPADSCCTADVRGCPSCLPGPRKKDLGTVLVQVAVTEALHERIHTLKARQIKQMKELELDTDVIDLSWEEFRSRRLDRKTTDELAEEYGEFAKVPWWTMPSVLYPPSMRPIHGLRCKGDHPDGMVHVWKPRMDEWLDIDVYDDMLFSFNLVSAIIMSGGLKLFRDKVLGIVARSGRLSSDPREVSWSGILEAISSLPATDRVDGEERAPAEALADLRNTLPAFVPDSEPEGRALDAQCPTDVGNCMAAHATSGEPIIRYAGGSLPHCERYLRWWDAYLRICRDKYDRGDRPEPGQPMHASSGQP